MIFFDGSYQITFHIATIIIFQQFSIPIHTLSM